MGINNFYKRKTDLELKQGNRGSTTEPSGYDIIVDQVYSISNNGSIAKSIVRI